METQNSSFLLEVDVYADNGVLEQLSFEEKQQEQKANSKTWKLKKPSL